MRKLLSGPQLLLFSFLLVGASCYNKDKNPASDEINAINLKRGDLISCGPPDKEFGSVDFEITCSKEVKGDFDLAIALLHSFEYDEAEKVFAKIIDKEPGCAMAYWGVAMSNYHPLWEPPTQGELEKGSKAIDIAESLKKKTGIEKGFIDALALFYENWKTLDHRTRSLSYEKAMEKNYAEYPTNKEVSIFYALSLVAIADPGDKSYTNQKKAGDILMALYNEEPNHPGIIHYIIHTYDYPVIAKLALPAARRYASVAPSSAHALHMPSHIFTRLGLWDDCIKSNIESVEAAKCYAESAGIKGHWDEELHGLDYLVYAYLQKGDNHAAGEQLKYIGTINEVFPINFKEAYTFAASPSRMVLENKNWQDAANLQIQPASFPWTKYPWQESIFHFTRLLGALHTKNLPLAESELAKLNILSDTLKNQKDLYKTKQVAIQIKMGEAWISFMKDKKKEALALMKEASDMEDGTSKHPVTPGEVLPARELYADMLLQMKQNEAALLAYEEVLEKRPARFNSIYGAGLAAENLGNSMKAAVYYKQLLASANPNSNRSEIYLAKSFLKSHSDLADLDGNQ